MMGYILSKFRECASNERFGWKSSIALTIDYLLFSLKRKSMARKSNNKNISEILTKLHRDGFYKLDGFINSHESARLSKHLTMAIQNNPHLVHPGTAYDKRIHGVEKLDVVFDIFSQSSLINELATEYMKRDTQIAFTLGASLESAPNNPGSGGGWHRDSSTSQFKAMLYLTDVGINDGAFQIIASSHRLIHAIKDNMIMHQKYAHPRIENSQIIDLLNSTGQDRLHTLTGKAGTVLLFDSSSIHRGSPIKEGTRLALTNYFYPVQDINNDLYQHFKPVAGHSNL